MLLLGSCAAEKKAESAPSDYKFTVTLSRAGGFTGLEERYAVSSDYMGRKAERMPDEALTTVRERPLPKPIVNSLRQFLIRNDSLLRQLQLSGTGNITTTIEFEQGNFFRRYSWPNLDPPVGSPPAIDTLYGRMLGIEHAIMYTAE